MNFRLLLFLGVWGLLPGSALWSQELPITWPPPGYRIVDDMVLPVLEPEGGTPGVWAAGIVPYRFDPNATPPISSAERARMRAAMDELEGASVVTFVPWTSESDYLLVVRNDPAFASISYSAVGRIGGAQAITIGDNHWDGLDGNGNPIAATALDRDRRVVMHELIHALGWYHEQSRSDRNNFITVNAANISQTACNNNACNGNFDEHGGADTTFAYDFGSVMHYRRNQFSSDPMLDTITCNPPWQSFTATIGTWDHFSYIDALEINTRYGSGSAPIPQCDAISPASAVVAGPTFLLTITGDRFLEGTPTVGLVQGSVVEIDGVPVPTTYVDGDTLQATVDASFLALGGCREVRVRTPGLLVDQISGPCSLSVVPAPTAFAIYGAETGHELGSRVAGIGDANGDGHDDYVVGIPGYMEDEGRVVCHSGANGAVLWSGGSGCCEARAGSSIVSVGDLDGDGVSDIAVGLPGWFDARGYVRVMSGANGSDLSVIFGTTPGDRLGEALSPVGDIDGDGGVDLAMGAPGWSAGMGRVLIVRATSIGGVVLRTLQGTLAGEAFGSSIGGGYDLNGDGVTDMAVGSPFHSGGGIARGRVRFINGSTGTTLSVRNGLGDSDMFGASVAVIPEPGGAPRGRVLIGAPEPGAPFGGPVGTGYVQVYGAFQGAIYPLVITLTGVQVGERFGVHVAGAGDANQDGISDYFIGANGAGSWSEQNQTAGRVELRTGENDSVLWEVSGTATGDRFGETVANVGDTDANGMPDFVIGLPGSDTTCEDAGQTRNFRPRLVPSARKPLISEVCWGEPDGVEITNFATTSRNLAGWRILWNDGIGAAQLSAPIDVVLAPGAPVVVKEPGAGFSETPGNVLVRTLFPPLMTTSEALTITLLDGSGLVVDEVRISDTQGIHEVGSHGGHFRGLALRTPATPNGGAERIWGLDSNGGGDWTEQATTSVGLENRSSGVRGTDPLPVARVLLNEIDWSAAFLELKNVEAFPVDIQSWSILASGQQNQPHVRGTPFATTTLLNPCDFVVIDGNTSAPPPSEIPPSVPLVSLGAPLPYSTHEFDCALYDHLGRLVDLVRSTGHDDAVVHNHPRAPSAWDDFVGAAGRTTTSNALVIGRDSLSSDSETGGDWSPYFHRSMGSVNGPDLVGGNPGHASALDVRMNSTFSRLALTVILNAGTSQAGSGWAFFFNSGHEQGLGAFFGLDPSAIGNYLALTAGSGLTFGTLDSRGSARLDVPFQTGLIGTQADGIFFILDASGGVLLTRVLELDITG